MKPKRTISAHVLAVGVMTLLIIGSLVVYQIYSALTKSQISEMQAKAIKPLDGIIKEDVVENLVGRRWFNRRELDRPIIVVPPVIEEDLITEDSLETGDSPVATETGKVEE